MNTLKTVFTVLILIQTCFDNTWQQQQDTKLLAQNPADSIRRRYNVSASGQRIKSAKSSKFHESTNFIPAAKVSTETGNRLKVYSKPGKAYVEGVGKGDAYTDKELESIAQLRQRLEKVLTLEYMLEPSFFIRFLKAKRMNLDAAEEMIRKLLEWRESEKIDDLRPEEFVWWERNVPFYFMLDNEGRPGIVSGIYGLNLRTYVLTGRAPEIMRYIWYAVEMSTRNIRRHSHSTGIEYYYGHLIFSLRDYSNRNHACLGCIPYLLQIARTYENYFPELAGRIIGVNAPKVFETALNIVRPILSSSTLGGIKLYGFDKTEWQRELLKIFPAETLTPEFGGTRNLTQGTRS